MRAALLACVALCACGPAVLGIDVELVTRQCPSATADRDPVKGVTRLTFKLTGDGLNAQTIDADYATGTARIPAIPIGANRRITVDAKDATGRIRSRADSGKFDALGPDDVHVRLFLRTVDAFTLTTDASAICTRMTTPRAGHQLTLLPDGRVLITGGFSFDGSSPPKLVYHDDAELFDPQNGSFQGVATASGARRAGHAALPVTYSAGTEVLLAGGEGPANAAGDGQVVAIKPFELFENQTWSAVSNQSTLARAHLASGVDLKTGNAVLAGGQAGRDVAGVQVYDTVTYFNPQDSSVHEVIQHLRFGPLADAAGVALSNKKNGISYGGLALVGGRDSQGKVVAQVSGLIWNETANGGKGDYVDDPAFRSLSLPSPRAHHVAVRMPDDTVLTAGGVTSLTLGAFDYSNATNEITVVDGVTPSVYNLPEGLSQARADSCAITLDNGTALIAGGAWKDGSGQHSAKQVDLVTLPINDTPKVRSPQGPPGSSGDGTLQQSRYRAACVKLKDGSILVSGGLQLPTGTTTPVVLDSAEIYMPPG